MPDKKELFVTRLLQQTSAGKVKWEPTMEERVFQASFPSYSVKIWTEEAFDIETAYVIGIFNDSGTQIERMDNRELKEAGLVHAWTVMRDLHQLARRQALGVEQALDSLLDSLDDDDD
jgi:hypothetical protein